MTILIRDPPSRLRLQDPILYLLVLYLYPLPFWSNLLIVVASEYIMRDGSYCYLGFQTRTWHLLNLTWAHLNSRLEFWWPADLDLWRTISSQILHNIWLWDKYFLHEKHANSSPVTNQRIGIAGSVTSPTSNVYPATTTNIIKNGQEKPYLSALIIYLLSGFLALSLLDWICMDIDNE